MAIHNRIAPSGHDDCMVSQRLFLQLTFCLTSVRGLRFVTALLIWALVPGLSFVSFFAEACAEPVGFRARSDGGDLVQFF